MIFLAILALSFAGISVLGFILAPAQWLGSSMIQIFLSLFGVMS
jgi:hypothetical protein